MSKSKTRPREVRASSLNRLAFCPASHRREEGKADKSDAAAATGNRVHAALAGEEVVLSHEDEKMVAAIIQNEAEVMEMLGVPKPPDAKLIREERLKSGKRFPAKNGFTGKPDAVWVWVDSQNQKCALVIDYKTGYGHQVPTDESAQLQGYGVLVWRKYGIERLYLAIIQPFYPVQVVEMEGRELPAAEATVAEIVDAAHDPHAIAQAGELQCKFCKAKEDCPEAAALVIELARTHPNDLDTSLTDLLEACATAEKVIDAIRARAKATLQGKPDAIKGWELKAGHKRTVIPSESIGEVLERMVAAGCSLPEAHEATSISKSKLVATLRKASGLRGGELDEKVAEVLAGLSEELETMPRLERSK